MENASKALFMAAGVLIGILILSLAVYLFISFGSTSAELHKQNAEQQIAQFNSQFTSYEGKECTIYEVVSVAGLATDNNIYYELTKSTGGKDNYISVQVRANHLGLGNQGYIEGNKNRKIDYNAIIQKDVNDMPMKVEEDGIPYQALRGYTCTVEISPFTQRVWNVTFTSKK